MNKAYNRINWENYPSDATPVNEQNLNRMDGSLDEIDNRVITLDTTKATKTEVAPLIKEIEFNESNGIFTITRKDGSKFTIDTKLEKIAINFGYDPTTQKISLTLIDGTVQYIDLSALITQYEFMDTDTVSFFIDESGKVSSIVKEGSIEEKHLRPNYLAEIKVEAAKAEASAAAADASEKEAKKSENAAKASQTAAKASEDAAADSAADAADSEAVATQKAADAAVSATIATQKATDSGNSASAAATSATNAASSASAATSKANAASTSATAAAESATNADTYAKKSQSYAVGGTGTREGEDSDNAEYYYEQAKNISQGLAGALLPMGTVTFANLPALSDAEIGWMYNISNEFTTNSYFKEGSGKRIPAGSNVYKTADEKWDILAGTPVTGVKGNAESTYRKGNVNLTPANIGSVAKSGDTMSGSLTVNIPQPSGDVNARKGLQVKREDTNRSICITASDIEAIDDNGAVGNLILNPDGNSNHGSVTVVSPLRVEGGMFVNNGIPQGYGDSSYFMCFNAYTSDATGGKVSYRNRKDVGFADQWHWQTVDNNYGKFYKILLKHGTYGFSSHSMFSFNLEIYQSYVYWKVSISGYRLVDNDGTVRWYIPRATLIDTSDTTNSSFYIMFGKDADDKLWIAFPAAAYTGISICNINLCYRDSIPLFDTNSAFDIVIESSLTGTIQFDQYIWGPIKRNEFNELKNSVSDGKAQVASAITALGITTAADATFATMVNNINGLFQQDTYTASLCGIWWMNSSTTYNMGRMVIQNAKQCKYAKIRLDICYSSSSNARLDAWGSKTNWELNNSTITFNVANGTGTSGRSGSLAISDSAGSLVPYGVSELKTFAGHAHINVPLINVGGSYVTINVTLSSTKTSFEIATVAVFAHAMFSN